MIAGRGPRRTLPVRPLEPQDIVRYEEDGPRVVLLDQRKLPGEEVDVVCRTAAEVADAIKTMVVRGAPAIGIAADQLSGLFEPFTQADPHASGDRQGNGLGLAIAREVVDLMHGRLQVTSTLGEGSTFRFGVPLARARAGDASAG